LVSFFLLHLGSRKVLISDLEAGNDRRNRTSGSRSRRPPLASDSRDIRLALAATWSKERPSGGEISPLGLARGKISPLSVGGELVDAIMTVGMMLLMWYVHLEPPGEE
jgi:hypothetical protein